MIRQPEREHIRRLAVKALDRVFVARAREGIACSLFEAQALTEWVKRVYFRWLSELDAIQAGQVAITMVKRLARCKMVPGILTLHAGPVGEDHQYRLSHGSDSMAALRQRQIERMAREAGPVRDSLMMTCCL